MEVVKEDYFEPCCRWKKGKDSDSIDIDLDGFEIKDVKVRLTPAKKHRYEISISAESPKLLRKKIEIPDDHYNLEQIRAFFLNGTLNLQLPKKGDKLEISMPKLEIKEALQEFTQDMENKIVSAVGYLASKGNIAAVGVMLMASGLFAYKYYTECYGF